MKKEKLEEILEKVLELKEKGKLTSEILNSFPDYKEEIKDVLNLINLLEKEREKIFPPKEILNEIILRVTQKEPFRYSFREEIKGRSSILELIMRKVYLGIVVLALMVVFGIYWQATRGKLAILPIEKELKKEQELVEKDIAELEKIIEEKDFESLEEDLEGMINEGESLEDSEKELALELDNFSQDFKELKEIEADNLLEDLDLSLKSIEE